VAGTIEWQILFREWFQTLDDEISAKLEDRQGHGVSIILASSAILTPSSIDRRCICDPPQTRWRQNKKASEWNTISIASKPGAIERTFTVSNSHFHTRISPISRFQSF
jgi:hypothetical protein